MSDLTGQTFGRLVVLRRNPQPYRSPGGQCRSRWDCQCVCGNTATVVGVSLRVGRTTSCGCYQNELRIAQGHANAVARPTYNSMHHRLRKKQGAAKTRVCVGCGGRAHQWSYDHLDTDEVIEEMVSRGKVRRVAYSLKFEHYQPRCHSCHHTFDYNLKRVAS